MSYQILRGLICDVSKTALSDDYIYIASGEIKDLAEIRVIVIIQAKLVRVPGANYIYYNPDERNFINSNSELENAGVHLTTVYIDEGGGFLSATDSDYHPEVIVDPLSSVVIVTGTKGFKEYTEFGLVVTSDTVAVLDHDILGTVEIYVHGKGIIKDNSVLSVIGKVITLISTELDGETVDITYEFLNN